MGTHSPSPGVGEASPPFPLESRRGFVRGGHRGARGGLTLFLGTRHVGKMFIGFALSEFGKPSGTWAKRLSGVHCSACITKKLLASAACGGLRPNRPICRRSRGARFQSGA